MCRTTNVELMETSIYPRIGTNERSVDEHILYLRIWGDNCIFDDCIDNSSPAPN